MPECRARFTGAISWRRSRPGSAWASRPRNLGRLSTQLVEFPWAEVQQVPNRIEGEVIEVDSFGNLITNITRAMLDGVPTATR